MAIRGAVGWSAREIHAAVRLDNPVGNAPIAAHVEMVVQGLDWVRQPEPAETSGAAKTNPPAFLENRSGVQYPLLDRLTSLLPVTLGWQSQPSGPKDSP